MSGTWLCSDSNESSMLQSPISPTFLAWLHKHNIITHGIAAAFVDEGWRGVAATEEVSAGVSSRIWTCSNRCMLFTYRPQQPLRQVRKA